MILHVDLDAFFASIEQRDNPTLRDKPIIVGGPAPLSLSPSGTFRTRLEVQSGSGRSLPSRGVVATASYEARKFGIYSGMPLFQAKRLCPGAIFVKGDFAKYEKASLQFVEICSSYSPVIEQASLDELYMDLAGTEKLYTPMEVARKIQVRVAREIRVTCSVGIAGQKTVAKIASGFKKPNGITEVPKGREKEFLGPLSISEIPGCGPKTQKILRDLDIKILSEFSKMRPEHVELILGKNGLHLWQVANGIDESKVIQPQAAKSTSRSTTFPFNTNNREFIEGMLFYLTQRVAGDLRMMGLGGKCIAVTVRTDNFETFSMQRTISYSISMSHELFLQAKSLLNSLWDKRTKLRLIGVGVSQFIQLKPQIQLIEMDVDKWVNLESAMDKIRNKHGFLSIAPASLMRLKGAYPSSHRAAFRLPTPSLSR